MKTLHHCLIMTCLCLFMSACTTPAPQDRASALTAEGSPDVLYHKGNQYAHGDGVPQDDTKAFDYYLAAARGGSVKAQYALGYLYRTGRGVPRIMPLRPNGSLRLQKLATQKHSTAWASDT